LDLPDLDRTRPQGGCIILSLWSCVLRYIYTVYGYPTPTVVVALCSSFVLTFQFCVLSPPFGTGATATSFWGQPKSNLEVLILCRNAALSAPSRPRCRRCHCYRLGRGQTNVGALDGRIEQVRKNEELILDLQFSISTQRDEAPLAP